MLWVLIAEDRADAGPLRAETREAHLEWVASHREHIVRAGPFLADDGETMIGSLLVLDFPDRDAVESWAADDPYARAGLFSSVRISAWRETVSPG